MDWKNLEDIRQVDELEKHAQDHRVIIFKHSTRCGVSSMVLKSLNRELSELEFPNTAFYFLDLIKYRNISNRIAEKWQIEHQSPQMIILENGKVVKHASHYRIDASMLTEV